jgi:mannosylglucosylglycerate synthase
MNRSRARRVSILHYTGPPTIGGVERTIEAQARFLRERGFRVQLLVGRGGDLGPGIETRFIPKIDSRGAEIDAVNLELASGVVSDRFEMLVEEISQHLADELAESNVLIIHNVLTLHKNLALTSALSNLLDRGALPPVVAWCHDFAWIDPIYGDDLHPGQPWDLLRAPWSGVRYVAVSRDRQLSLARLLRIASEKITVIPPGIDIGSFLKLEPETMELINKLDLLAADPFLLLPSRITRRKNIELAIAIAVSMRELGMTPQLLVTGPPGAHNSTNLAYLEDLKADAKRQNADDIVVFLSEIMAQQIGVSNTPSDAVIGDLFRLADAMLLPSRAEGFGIPLLEAELVGLPVFCSDIAVFQDVTGGSAQTFSLDDEPKDIANMIAAALERDPRYEAKRRVRTQSAWQVIYEKELLPIVEVSGDSANAETDSRPGR